MKVSVTGASGFIGRRLVDSLIRQGHEVTALSRAPNKTFPAGVRVVAGDLTAADCPLASMLSGCEVVFHCAGEVRDGAIMRSLHVEGTRALVRAATNEAAHSTTGVHWVQLSSVGAYGPPAGRAAVDRIVTELSPVRPVGEYEFTKTKSDELVMNAAASGPLSYSIVRPSNVFAADMPNASLRALGAMVRRGIFFYIGRPGAVATYVHVDDVVETLSRCGTDARARGQLFNLSNDCRLEDMINGMAAALGVKPPWLRLPEPFVRAATGVASKLVRMPLTQERIDALVIRTRYPCTKLERVLDFEPRVSVPNAIGEVLLARGA